MVTLELATLTLAVVKVALLTAVVVITEVTVAVVAKVVEIVCWVEGTATVNVVEAESPLGLPLAVIVYAPAPTLAITKDEQVTA